MDIVYAVFNALLSAGPIVLLPIIITIIGLLFRVKLLKAFRAGLTIGIGFAGIKLVINLLSSNLGPAAKAMVENFGIHLDILDVGWGAIAAVTWSSPIIPLLIFGILLTNVVLLLFKLTNTLDVDIWNYHHMAIVGIMAYFVTGNVFIGLGASIIMAIISFKLADWTAPYVEKYFGIPGVSLPTMSALSSIVIAAPLNQLIDKIPGVNQTQTNAKAGMTFASGLRALLRQDPNIIMVGEIRDGETANLGVQAALTGHLVFSTLHTNNAATCLPRLLDMGIEPFLIASTVKAVIGQRLVRRLCMNCRQEYTPNQEELKYITEMFNIDTKSIKKIHDLERQAFDDKIGGDTPMGSTEQTIARLWKPNPEGCDECGHNGFKGRVGIYEVLGISIPIQKMITANATSNDIQDQAISEGMVTMQMDGLIKSLRGITTTEEVLRATRE